MSKTLIVAKYEYFKVVRGKSFWLTTLFFPIFLGVVMFISGYSGSRSEQKFKELDRNIDSVEVVDETGILPDEVFSNQNILRRSSNLAASIQKVKNGEVDLLIYYPSDLSRNAKFEIYSSDDGNLFITENYTAFASSLLSSSALLKVEDEQVRSVINKRLSSKVIVFDESGKEVIIGVEKFILPGIFALVFFIIVFSSSQFMLQSVSEEKENRMIEMLLSVIKQETLLYGKIIGLCGVVLTQITTWLILSIGVVFAALKFSDFNIPVSINWDTLNWDIVPVSLYLILVGFLLFAAIMIGVGSAGTNYKDSQGLSSIFILMSIFPIYFILFIISEPNGILARILSFFPFTSSMILLIRNSISSLSPFELFLGVIANFVYVVLAFKLSTILFNLGSLMYNRRPSTREIIYVFRK